ncbi:MAG: right-handed parallel beta-helix repeat-containing protein [bacterium]|nr:right-handed parallel beta-helix repeat-containing protein [bacterium]
MKKQIIKITVLTGIVLLLLCGCRIETFDNSGSGGDGGGGGEQDQYYVSVTGSDSNDGSQATPWRTIQHGLDTIKAGEVLNIVSGVYTEELYLNTSGSSDKKVYIKGESFANTIINGADAERDLFFIENSDFIELSQLTFMNAPRAGLRLSQSHYVGIHNCVFAENGKWGVFTNFSDNTTIANCDAYGSIEEHGIYISNSSDNATVQNCLVHHNYASGIQVNADPSMGGDGISSDCLIENNLLYENGTGGGAAINLASVRTSTIQNNMIYHNYAGGIAAWDDGQGNQWGSKDLVIIHNTIYFRSSEGRWAISLKNGSTGAEIYNNIMSGGLRGGFEFNTNCLTGAAVDYNVYFRPNSTQVVTDEDVRNYTLTEWQLAGYDRNSVTALPINLFVDITAVDLHLRSSAAAVNVATARGLTYDFEGNTRPQGGAPDIGADEVME